MKYIYYLLAIALISGCKSTNTGDEDKNLSESDENIIEMQKEADSENPAENDETAEFFVVVADTSDDYFTLQKKMYDIAALNKLVVDTMGRYYNMEKNLICLPDDSEDEIYAGSYFPRRFPSTHLSIEYLTVYKNNALEKTLALIGGIYETMGQAQSMAAKLKKNSPKVFVVRANIFIGCMH